MADLTPTPRLDAAEAEAKRFLASVATLRQGMRTLRAHAKAHPEFCYYTPWAPRDHAAVKRASMDLSNTLAALRKGGA